MGDEEEETNLTEKSGEEVKGDDLDLQLNIAKKKRKYKFYIKNKTGIFLRITISCLLIQAFFLINFLFSDNTSTYTTQTFKEFNTTSFMVPYLSFAKNTIKFIFILYLFQLNRQYLMDKQFPFFGSGTPPNIETFSNMQDELYKSLSTIQEVKIKKYSIL